EHAVTKCLNSPEYFLALGTAISKAIEKGMQDGLPIGITHGKEGWVLTDVAAHNPSAKANYVFALQKLQGVNFPLLAELKTNKDASIEADVFIPLAEPFSVVAVTCTEGTFDTVPATADTTAALSATFASSSIVDPISIDEYEVTGTDDQPVVILNVVDENANPFLNVDDAKLNIP
nr:hypothetical protein [Tanacetum cinerariifolium]